MLVVGPHILENGLSFLIMEKEFLHHNTASAMMRNPGGSNKHPSFILKI